MDRQTKEETVAELQETLSQVAALIVTDFRGLTVEEADGLRSEIKKAECQYRVIKNTLLKRAIAGTDLEGLADLFKGPSAIAFSFTDPVAPAKVIDKFASKSKHMVVKGGFLDGTMLDEGGVKNLATMKGKEELQAELLMTFMAPAQNFAALINAVPQNFMYLLNAKKDALGGE